MINTPVVSADFNAQSPCKDIRDVADFHMHWPQIRPVAQRLCANPALSSGEQEMMLWMIALMDRIGPQDLESDEI